jgi:hypothetical protein
MAGRKVGTSSDEESPTKVGTDAYVNPVVAVGYFLDGEELGPRTILGTW